MIIIFFNFFFFDIIIRILLFRIFVRVFLGFFFWHSVWFLPPTVSVFNPLPNNNNWFENCLWQRATTWSTPPTPPHRIDPAPPLPPEKFKVKKKWKKTQKKEKTNKKVWLIPPRSGFMRQYYSRPVTTCLAIHFTHLFTPLPPDPPLNLKNCHSSKKLKKGKNMDTTVKEFQKETKKKGKITRTKTYFKLCALLLYCTDDG